MQWHDMRRQQQQCTIKQQQQQQHVCKYIHRNLYPTQIIKSNDKWFFRNGYTHPSKRWPGQCSLRRMVHGAVRCMLGAMVACNEIGGVVPRLHYWMTLCNFDMAASKWAAPRRTINSVGWLCTGWLDGWLTGRLVACVCASMFSSWWWYRDDDDIYYTLHWLDLLSAVWIVR